MNAERRWPPMAAERRWPPNADGRRTPMAAERRWLPNTDGRRTPTAAERRWLPNTDGRRTPMAAERRWLPNTDGRRTPTAADRRRTPMAAEHRRPPNTGELSLHPTNDVRAHRDSEFSNAVIGNSPKRYRTGGPAGISSVQIEILSRARDSTEFTKSIGRANDSPNLPKSVGGLAEPARQLGVEFPLALADPGDMTVGSEQQSRNIQCRSRIRDDIHPVGPAVGGQGFGAVQE
ncbi:hypothetical protein NRB20_08430 [Nocardia sp. RB20]|uniref:Uncharacterized protein n=1 Tax=Nocardia macrotermitis TaxID=2585198 RepID=A0A7K0CW89_9NOCA|nr:hypothetical protein [Nocardia macrotermitis]